MDQTLFPDDELIRRAAAGDPVAAADLDHAGFLVRPEENANEYADRVASVKKHCLAFYQQFDKKGKLEIYPGLIIQQKDCFPREIVNEAAERTENAYGFSICWVPGFFPEKELGVFWGGCALWQEEEPVPVIIIRKTFSKRKKWFIYDRTELISHELCHAARIPLMDGSLEEHFAYGTSEKWLRRTIGNCFQKDTDAIFFAIPALILALVQAAITIFEISRLPILPFWILALICPVFLLTRNLIQTRNYKSAKRNLELAGFTHTREILFRSVYKEICTIAETRPDKLNALLNSYAEKEFRWKVILKRFQKITTPAPSKDL